MYFNSTKKSCNRCVQCGDHLYVETRPKYGEGLPKRFQLGPKTTEAILKGMELYKDQMIYDRELLYDYLRDREDVVQKVAKEKRNSFQIHYDSPHSDNPSNLKNKKNNKKRDTKVDKKLAQLQNEAKKKATVDQYLYKNHLYKQSKWEGRLLFWFLFLPVIIILTISLQVGQAPQIYFVISSVVLALSIAMMLLHCYKSRFHEKMQYVILNDFKHQLEVIDLKPVFDVQADIEIMERNFYE